MYNELPNLLAGMTYNIIYIINIMKKLFNTQVWKSIRV